MRRTGTHLGGSLGDRLQASRVHEAIEDVVGPAVELLRQPDGGHWRLLSQRHVRLLRCLPTATHNPGRLWGLLAA